MTETLILDFTFEATRDHNGSPFVVASYDARAHIQSLDDWRDFRVAALEIEGVAFWRPGDPLAKPIKQERWFEVVGTDPLYPAMLAEAEKLAPDAICKALCAGEIGPIARLEADADHRRDMAREGV